MKNLFTTIALLLVLLITPFLSGQQEDPDQKYSKVSISIQDKSDIVTLQRMGFDMEGTKLNEHSLEIILSESEILQLKVSGFSFDILIDDMTKYYQERSSRSKIEMKKLEEQMKEKYTSSSGFGFGSLAGFYTYDEVAAELDTMRMLYPDLITAKYSIDTTFEGRSIWAVKISDNPDIAESEPAIFLNALTHAREPEGMMAVVYFMYYLLENYGSDPEITYLVNNREFYFVPVINADGYVYNEQHFPYGGGMWRKNRRDNDSSTCYGVDINRNYGYMWGYNNIGSSPNPCSIEYRGTGPFSEAESQAVRDFCIEHNFSICNNYHAYWNVVFPPWSYNLTQSADSAIFNNLIRLGTQFNNYQLGIPGLPDNYELNGGVTDWMYGDVLTKPEIFAVATEVGNNDDGFWPPPERIFPLAEENVYLNKVLAWGPGMIDDPPYVIEADINPSSYMLAGDSIIVTAAESNPQDYTSVVTAYVINSADITVDEFELTETAANSFAGSWFLPEGEDIYRILLKDSGIEIPSNFYYKENSRFTTAGPVTLDSVSFVTSSSNYCFVKPYVTNGGSELTITNAQVRLLCKDPWAVPASPVLNLPDLAPGESVGSSGWFVQRYIDSLVPGPLYFNLQFEILSDGWTLWEDSIQLVVGPVRTEVVNQQLLTFSLSQNFPNPYNPETNIKYSIREPSKVTLKVYDILGRETATLINEYKPSGTYELTWNAADLPSGVYFYQIRAGDFVQTRKMILLK